MRSEEVIKYIRPTEKDRSFVIVIDGRCASGKTTLAEELSRMTGASVIHMDDFFLPGELRTKERLSEPGGNVHYERFFREVIPFLGNKSEFSYGRFNCSVMDIDSVQKVKASDIRIVEGSYSMHPYFGDYADLYIYLNVDQDEQMKRIVKRDGPDKAEKYKNIWIPMEEKYFSILNTDRCICL